ncbi:MAG TPA: hypothetical protein VFQ58_03100, partial [Flavisolibacter sp.]|nr:hypothetical protein [Flavisolibacter sp.]
MEENQFLFSLTIDPATKAYLNDTSKWARFIAITGMIVLVIVLIFTILGATVLNNASIITVSGMQEMEGLKNSIRVGMVVGSIIVTGIAFIPLLYLFNFANKMKKSLALNQQAMLNESFFNLKKYFRFLGIVLI